MDQREQYYGVLYGRQINRKHLERIWKKLNYYYSRLPEEERKDCCEVVFELLDYIDPHPVRYDYAISIFMKKGFLPRLVEIMQGIPSKFWLCTFTHGHLGVEINQITYEGICYKTVNDTRLIFFVNEWNDENDSVRNRLKCLPENQHYLEIYSSIQGEKINEAFAHWMLGVLNVDISEFCQRKELNPVLFEVKYKN